MTAPERTHAQRLDALRRANDVRAYRARLKRDLKAGRRSIDSLLRHPPEEIATMKVIDLLLHVPKYGRVKVGKALKVCTISPSKTVEGMTDRQRYELLREIRARDAERFARTPQRDHGRVAA